MKPSDVSLMFMLLSLIVGKLSDGWLAFPFYVCSVIWFAACALQILNEWREKSHADE